MTERPMPDRRNAIRQKVKIGNTKVYFDVGFYEDDSIGELFIVVERTGDHMRWLYDEVARLGSKLIQHGCPVEAVAEGWLGTKGKPCGPVQDDARIKHCTSVLDYVARHLLIYYCGREELAHVRQEDV